jgi:hypothetical protein
MTSSVGETSARTRVINTAAALVFLVGAMWAAYIKIGWPPVAIVGGSGLVGFVIWQRTYLLIFAFVGPTLYALTAIGLFYRIPFAGFLAWFIFIGPGVAEFTHFIFPLLRPDVSPSVASAITAHVSNGRQIADMPNYWLHTTGRYYFPGLYTACLPMIPGIYAIWRLAIRRR